MWLSFVARLCVFLCLFSTASGLNGQDFQVRYLGIQNGLSNNAVNAIFQDHNGFMWFGTYVGLNCYDGYGFKTYRNVVDDSTSISSNNINAMDEDTAHRLWIDGQKGLSIFNSNTSAFSHSFFSLHKEPAKGCLSDNILAIRAMNTGGVLVGTQHKGLFYFPDHRNGRNIPLTINGKESFDYYVSSIDVDERKNTAYVFVSEYGLCKLALKTLSLRLKNNSVKTAYCLKGAQDGRFGWEATRAFISLMQPPTRFRKVSPLTGGRL